MKRIMFNDKFGLTDAVLSGRKTMTRRVAYGEPMQYQARTGYDDDGFLVLLDGWQLVARSAYRVGDLIAVAQSYKTAWDVYQERWESLNDPSSWRTPDAILGDDVQSLKGWDNKMFVSSLLMPYWIRITDVKLERLQDISNEDAMREGVFHYDKPPLYHEMDRFAPWPPYVKPYKWDGNNLKYFCEARYAFAHLIDKVSGVGTWRMNPWVYVYEFELVK